MPIAGITIGCSCLFVLEFYSHFLKETENQDATLSAVSQTLAVSEQLAKLTEGKLRFSPKSIFFFSFSKCRLNNEMTLYL